jgi:TM2 domain-containing membrane protein YozV
METYREKEPDEFFCYSCGIAVKKEAESCPNCGVRQKSKHIGDISISWMATFLFCLFLGFLGIHRFYNRKAGTGILMLLTFGGFGIWVIIDLILIVTGNFKDGDGNLIKLY